MAKALVIGRGVQGKRWINNLQKLGYSIEAYGRDYIEKLQRNEYYDIIILAVPHYAFLEVAEELFKRKIQARKIIVEKPGASNLDEFIYVKEALAYIGYPEMFLPLYIEYGFLEPREIVYISKLPKSSIKEINEEREEIILVTGRRIDLNFVRDLFFHPASLYRIPYFTLERKFRMEKPYGIVVLTNERNRITLGRLPSAGIRKYSPNSFEWRDFQFTNPMLKQLQYDYEELCLDKLPQRVWKTLDNLL